MTTMAKILREEVQRKRAIPFSRFMELALYCPLYGYYEREGVIGRAGDYYTNVATGSLFGQLLAFQFAEWLKELPCPVQLVEAGAHGGQLCADILGWLNPRHPDIAKTLEYWIIEPSSVRRNWQKARLEEFAGRVRWFDALQSLPSSHVSGVIFSNELLDAMPVRRLGWDANSMEWFEWGVTTEGEKFVWQRLPVSQEELFADSMNAGLDLSALADAALPDGFTVEISPAASAWWSQAARTLRYGKLLTIDYGLTTEDFFAPQRIRGTLRAYYRHHASADLLANPGEQDLTAHINFTQLQRAGEAMGLRTEGLFSQEQFLTRIAKKTWEPGSTFGDWTPARVRQFQTLTHPEHLGRPFQVLIQARVEGLTG